MNNQMPGKGSGIFTPFTGVLPDNKSETVNAGIPLFELVCIGVPTGTQIFGFHDVDVRIRHRERSASFELDYDVRWHRGLRGERNYIRYDYDRKTQRSYAFAPDDPIWHNRMLLAELLPAGKFVITQYISQAGVITREAITDEIKFIGSCLYDHSVTSEGKVLFRSKILAEAQAREMEEKRKGVNCQTIHSAVEEVEALVRAHGVGWKSHPDFINGFRKDIEEQIKQRFAPAEPVEPADMRSMLLKTIRSLSQQEKLELLSQPEPVQEISGSVEPKKKIDLEKVGNPQLFEMADDMDIFTKGMHRADIIKAIKSAIAEKEKTKAAPSITQEQEFK